MDAETALNEAILARVLEEAIRRGDVTMTLDQQGVPRYSAKEPVVQSEPTLAKG